MTIILGDRLMMSVGPATVGPVEIVERKGLGHPDSICDALAETASLALCRLYRARFETILHHNVDKVLLCGGEAQPAFAGGRITKPIEVFIAGRATRRFRGIDLPVEESVAEACRGWLRDHLRHLDADRHVNLHILLRPSSEDLVKLFPNLRRAGSILANDTSCGVGYAPLSPLERAVCAVEQHLNAASMKMARPEIGEDVKVMGVRRNGAVHLTVAAAFVGAHVADAADYFLKKAGVSEVARAVAGGKLGAAPSVEVNTADAPPDQLYLTVTGTSAESGDDGEAGRGNRANGLITPYRPMTIESVAGKNPVNHIGKIYNLAASRIAVDLVRQIDEIEAAECFLVSRIGQPIEEPQIVDLRLQPAPTMSPDSLRPRIEEVVLANLRCLDRVADDFLNGGLGVEFWPLREALQ